MLDLTKDLKNDTLFVKLSGTLDERSDIEAAIGKPPAKLVINSKELIRINSHGVRVWVRYFQKLTDAGIKLTFQECSPAIVQQLNLIGNFIPKSAVIESVCAPYFCPSCKGQFITVFKMDELKAAGFKVSSLKCPKCGTGEASFDDIESEYFQFFKSRA